MEQQPQQQGSLQDFFLTPLYFELMILSSLRGSAACSLSRSLSRGVWALAVAVLAVVVLVRVSPIPLLYHSIRSQSALKLYVIYNIIEVLDRLVGPLGWDLLNSSAAVLAYPAYAAVHTMLLLYQVTTLNVAVNSNGSVLLTLLVSNQFAELKSTVFKKYDAASFRAVIEADVAKRATVIVFLVAIGASNAAEAGMHDLDSIAAPLAVVYMAEVVVDWVKHAFAVRASGLSPRQVYKDTLTCANLPGIPLLSVLVYHMLH